MTELREIQNILCTFINFLFNADPNLANIVFWQTYPKSINAVATRGIPSMQICTSTVTEVFVKSGSLEQVVRSPFFFTFVTFFVTCFFFKFPPDLRHGFRLASRIAQFICPCPRPRFLRH